MQETGKNETEIQFQLNFFLYDIDHDTLVRVCNCGMQCNKIIFRSMYIYYTINTYGMYVGVV